VICGFTEPRGSRKKFGALIAGIYDGKNELHYSGHVGGGFNEALLREIHDQLTPLISKKCPFKKEPKVNMPVTWVKPKLLAEVSFAEWTKDNIMRQPIFQGLRSDKDAKSVKKEIPEQSPEESLKNTKSKKIKDLVLTNLEKIYWPKEKYTKGDLISYYEQVAPYILPYLKNRPIMLHRYPDGITGMDFYHKDMKFSHPDWVKTFPVKHEGKVDNYLLINDLRSLLYAVNLGSIDLHPFHSNVGHLDNPDYCVIDLDPHDISFDHVVEVALVIHDLLTKIKVTHCCKTSGGKGMHILIPLQGKYDFDQSRQFAEVICHLVHEKLPNTTSMERSPEKRPKMIYLDCLQNRTGQSIVAPYSARPRPNATVSTPLAWKEVKKGLDVSKFTIETVPKRLSKIGDIFKPVIGKGINMKTALQALSVL
jgi:bifunctional non-homologous end joining protein LigD